MKFKLYLDQMEKEGLQVVTKEYTMSLIKQKRKNQTSLEKQASEERTKKQFQILINFVEYHMRLAYKLGLNQRGVI